MILRDQIRIVLAPEVVFRLAKLVAVPNASALHSGTSTSSVPSPSSSLSPGKPEPRNANKNQFHRFIHHCITNQNVPGR